MSIYIGNGVSLYIEVSHILKAGETRIVDARRSILVVLARAPRVVCGGHLFQELVGSCVDLYPLNERNICEISARYHFNAGRHICEISEITTQHTLEWAVISISLGGVISISLGGGWKGWWESVGSDECKKE